MHTVKRKPLIHLNYCKLENIITAISTRQNVTNPAERKALLAASSWRLAPGSRARRRLRWAAAASAGAPWRCRTSSAGRQGEACCWAERRAATSGQSPGTPETTRVQFNSYQQQVSAQNSFTVQCNLNINKCTKY